MTPDFHDPVPDDTPSDDMAPRDLAPDAFDPGSMSTASLSLSKAVWFRRPWFLATIGVVVVIAISVVTDLPHPVSKAQDISQQNGVIKLINSDTPPCVFALNQSFTFYRQALAHTLAPSQLPTVKNYLLENQTACSFASGPIYDMTNNIQPIDTAPGKKIDAALQSTVKWITYDAVGAIVDIRRYFAGSVRQANVASLSAYENALANDRAAEIADVATASQMLGTTLIPIDIPAVPRLPHPVTKAQDISQQNGVIKLINSDTPPCVFALNQSFTFYRQALAHTLTPSQLPTVKNYLLENQTACSFASGPIYDMTNNIQPIDTAPGKKIDAALQSTVKWITYDAVGAIVDIRRYFAGSVRQANVASLSAYENALANDRAAEIADVATASQMLGTTLIPIDIPAVPRLPGT